MPSNQQRVTSLKIRVHCNAKGILSTYQSTLLLPGACRTGEQPAAVMDATRACGPRSMPAPPAPNFRDLLFATCLLLHHRLAWGQFCWGQGLLGGGSADTHASGHVILLSEKPHRLWGSPGSPGQRDKCTVPLHSSRWPCEQLRPSRSISLTAQQPPHGGHRCLGPHAAW